MYRNKEDVPGGISGTGKVHGMEKKHIRSALPLYAGAAVFLVAALVLPMYRLWAWIVAGLLCAAAVLLSEKILFPGRDIEVESKASTGDREIDRQIEEGREQLKRLCENTTGDPAIDGPLSRMYESGMKVFRTVADKPGKAPQVRKFMNYYLPTTAKLMEHYHTLSKVDMDGGNIEKALSDIRGSMGMIADAFEKQLDNLYREETLDVSSDIDVMETMIAADGLTDDGVQNIIKDRKIELKL